jgi:glycerol uptake facilitator-like aquaporin
MRAIAPGHTGYTSSAHSVIDRAIALLANTLATGGALVAILLIFGPIHARFNPAVTLCMVAMKAQSRRSAAG